MRTPQSRNCRTMLWVILLLGAGHPAAAQRLRGASVHGVVRDSTGVPIPGVEVAVAGSGMRSRSNDSGAYRIAGLAPGPATITARRIGYRASQEEVQLRDGEALAVDFRLGGSAAVLSGIQVTALREPYESRLAGFYARMERHVGRFVTRERIAIPARCRQKRTARAGKEASPLMRLKRSSWAAATITPSASRQAALSW